MKKDMFAIIKEGIFFVLLGVSAVGFITNKADSAKFDPSPIIEKVAMNEKANAVQDEQIKTLLKTAEETSKNVKEIKQLFYEELGYNRPAIEILTNAPLVRSVNPDGSPKNE